MQFIADLHIHSRYARACSKNLDLKNLEKYARIKGLDVLGTGDFTHPLWLKEIKEELTPSEGGILKSRGGFPFIMTFEISNVFTQGGKGRRVHSVVLAPDLEVAEQIVDSLGKRGRLDYDGRPIFGFSCIELVEMMEGISKYIEVIPAHAWTPWFSIFGSKSGFDSIGECFQEKAKRIHAIETGLSSDPPMNWRLSSLDGIQLLSFSDCHSFWPHRMGREATVFDLEELSYAGVLNAIRTGVGLKKTIEVNPAYGKYHWDGHRDCGVVLSPAESAKAGKICPVCRRTLTIGVESRVNELADRNHGHMPNGAKPYASLLPLLEIISLVRGGQAFSRKNMEEYHRIVGGFKNEFDVLMNVKLADLKKASDAKLAKAIIDVREGKSKVNPGYDGVYGEPVMEGSRPRKEKKPVPSEVTGKQKSLSEF